VRAMLKEIIIVPTIIIIYQGHQICCMKPIKLCMMERKEIFHRFRFDDKSKIMNHNSEIFGACKCNPRFRFRPSFCFVSNSFISELLGLQAKWDHISAKGEHSSFLVLFLNKSRTKSVLIMAKINLSILIKSLHFNRFISS
jgi:hypothetical protein